MKRHWMMLVVMFYILGACSQDEELQKTIFVKDERYPELPRYSESGYNTFGAFYDREVFAAGVKTPMKVIVTTGESTKISFIGMKGWNQEMSITIEIFDFYPVNYQGLMALDDLVIDLTNPSYRVFIKNKSIEHEAEILNGNLDFRNVKNVTVDTEQVEVILSGTFEFQALVNGEPITVSKGRFDVGVGNDAFYRI